MGRKTTSKIAVLFRERREELGLTRHQVVEKTPYRNVSKGEHRLWAMEEGFWTPDEKVVAWFAEALDIPLDDVRQAGDADLDQAIEHITKRLPANECGMCGKTLDEIGGRRLLGTITRALLIKGVQFDWGGSWSVTRAVRLDEPFRQLFVLMAGSIATDATLARAREQAQAGQTPWFCMRCAGQVCERCGALSREVPGSTFLADDGRTTYYALLPIGEPGCSDPGCGGHR